MSNPDGTSVATDALREIDIALLHVGLTLPGDVCDRNGSVVAPAGVELDRAGLKRLRMRFGRRFFVGPDWPDEEDASAVHDAVIQSQQARTSADRSHERTAATSVLSVEIKDPAGTSVRTVDVVLRDISRGGFSFLLPDYVHVGSTVRARFESLPNQPVLEGIVRNCEFIGGANHRVGVEFVRRTSGGARSAESN